MFDFDASKLLIVGVIALIFIPSKDLPRVLRQVGQFVSKARRMASEFQGQFMDAMREADMADLRSEAQKLAESARIDVGLDSITDLRSHLTRAEPGHAATAAEMMQETKPEVAAETAGPPAPETMDGAGMKDPNGTLRRLAGAANPSPPVAESRDDTPAAPVAHSAL